MAAIELVDADLVVALSGEGRLLDLCDEHPAERPRIAFSCRGGSCATCLVEVEGGAENLVPPSEDERETLARLGRSDAFRLGCQLVVHGAGRVRLRIAPPTRSA